MRRALTFAFVIAACGDSYGTEPARSTPDAGADAANPPDAGATDANPSPNGARCSPGTPFVNGHAIYTNGFSPSGGFLLPDEKTMFFLDDVYPEAGADYRLLFTTRPSTTAPFVAPSVLNELTSSSLRESDPTVTADGLTIIFRRDTSSSQQADLFFSTRLSQNVTFSTPQKLSLSTDGADEISPYVMPDGHALWFAVRSSPDSFDIFRARQADKTEFVTPVRVNEISTDADDRYPVVTDDELEIFWSSNRTDGAIGDYDIWTGSRNIIDEPFRNVRIVAEISTTDEDGPSWISPDACRLYYWTAKAGKSQIWMAERKP